jgi:hypothetical protein
MIVPIQPRRGQYVKDRVKHAIGMLQSELAHNRVARYCGVHQNTIQSLLMRSVMVWGDITKRDKTLLVVAGYLTGTRYRGEIAQLYVILFVSYFGVHHNI